MTEWIDPTLLLLGVVVAMGSVVQSTIGFGIAVVAAPVVVLVRPDLMPASLLVCIFAMPVAQLLTGPRDIDWRPLGWALGARVLATPVGVLLVAATTPDVIALTVGILILVTVLASVTAIDIRSTPRNAAVAGSLTGVSATAASIGGPFLALVLQHERPQRLRSTLAVFFLVGSVMAISALTLAGQVDREDVRAGLVWIPFVLLGHLLAGPLRSRISAEVVRRVVLAFCVIASISVITRTVL